MKMKLLPTDTYILIQNLFKESFYKIFSYYNDEKIDFLFTLNAQLPMALFSLWGEIIGQITDIYNTY
ncbi:hypothetical protein DERP_012385 [Dermatophagoides pteronyssinus]|uniref:Uncharacterized protein n=1 Tax=Dermatophagoides pteronyssinus TaxID=6956 RepID=A0ABQ8IUM7_DERPT|nr:hypothetical protein DERP_012385 [Dermatophagoides pteronyssinus]